MQLLDPLVWSTLKIKLPNKNFLILTQKTIFSNEKLFLHPFGRTHDLTHQFGPHTLKKKKERKEKKKRKKKCLPKLPATVRENTTFKTKIISYNYRKNNFLNKEFLKLV